MDKEKVLKRLYELIKLGENLLNTTHSSSGVFSGRCYFVNYTKYNAFKIKIKALLNLNENFHDYLVQFNEIKLNVSTSSLDATNKYLTILITLKEDIEDGFINLSPKGIVAIPVPQVKKFGF